jgi:hypothetical protein
LAGFDAVDLRSETRASLAVRRHGRDAHATERLAASLQTDSACRCHPTQCLGICTDTGNVGLFHFLEEGLQVGRRALDVAATERADLVVVDEFGPLELASRGWRAAVDALVHAGKAPLLIVVREELAGEVRDVYADVPSRVLDAIDPESVNEVIQWLVDDRSARGTE